MTELVAGSVSTLNRVVRHPNLVGKAVGHSRVDQVIKEKYRLIGIACSAHNQLMRSVLQPILGKYGAIILIASKSCRWNVDEIPHIRSIDIERQIGENI